MATLSPLKQLKNVEKKGIMNDKKHLNMLVFSYLQIHKNL